MLVCLTESCFHWGFNFLRCIFGPVLDGSVLVLMTRFSGFYAYLYVGLENKQHVNLLFNSTARYMSVRVGCACAGVCDKVCFALET